MRPVSLRPTVPMPLLSACVATLIAVASSTGRAAEPAVVRIQADDVQSLQDGLFALTQERLRPAGLSIDEQRAWMSLSEELPKAGSFDVRPTWQADAPPQPLTFELRPTSNPRARPLQISLAAPLQREVWIAARRLRKGSAVSCADLTPQSRDLRDLPKRPLTGPCEVAAEMVALRDISPRDVIRSADIGIAPDVAAGAPVRVSVAAGGISVTTSAVALADARVGDRVDVRLPKPTRVLKTRVIGPSAVQLMDESP